MWISACGMLCCQAFNTAAVSGPEPSSAMITSKFLSDCRANPRSTASSASGRS
jgi:hypothetical protein